MVVIMALGSFPAEGTNAWVVGTVQIPRPIRIRTAQRVPDRAHLNSPFACSASQSISEARIYRRFWYVTAITNGLTHWTRRIY